MFGPTDYLLANIFSALAVMSWQLGHDKNAPKPTPLLLPGMRGAEDPSAVRGDSLTTDQVDAILEARIGWSSRQPK